MGNESDTKDGTDAVQLPGLGKREDRNQDEKQVSAKKQKRDEVAEEVKYQDEIVSDSSFSDTEPDKNPEANKDSLSKQEKKGKPVNASCSSSLESLADDSEEDEGNIDIHKGDNSEESDEETQKKMKVLMDAASNAQECDLKNVENDSFSGSDDDNKNDGNSSDVIEKPHMPGKSLGNSEEGIEEKASKTPQENSKMQATPNEQNTRSKSIIIRNLPYSVERADLENLFVECGEIIDVRLHTDVEGRFQGFGHVEFATVEAAEKALQLNNIELLRCRIRIGIARPRRKDTPNRSFHVNFSNSSHSFQRDERSQPMKGSEFSRDTEQKIKPEMLTTCNEQSATSKTVYVGNLSYYTKQADMEFLFKECGEIVDIRLHTYRGYGHVEFSTAEAAQKALDLNNTKLLERTIRVDLAQEKGEYTYSRSNWSNSFQKCERNQCPPTIFVTGFDRSLPAEEVKATLDEHFGSCGEILKISVPKFRESGAVKGFAHLEFKDDVSMKKALHLDRIELGGYPLRVEKAKPRHDNQGIGNDRGGGHQFGGRDVSSYSSRVGWGKSGSGGWHALYFSDEGTERKNQL